MSYSGRETSVDAGSPVEMYEFRRGSTFWRYTSEAQDVIHAGNTYVAVPITRNGVEYTSEIGKAGLRITLPRDIGVAQSYIATPPSDITTITIYRQHRGDNEVVAVWTGRIINVEWRDSIVELNCEPVYTSMQRTGLRRLYQRNCPHVLYGAACGVSAAAHRVAGTVIQITGVTVRATAAAGYPSGYFAGGYMTWLAGATTERRMIASHSGDAVTITSMPTGLAVGGDVALYPGCDRTLATCNVKFGNSANYGGFPSIPNKNPFNNTVY